MAEREGDRSGGFGVGNGDARRADRTKQVEGQRRHDKRLQRIADRRAGRLDGYDDAAGKTACHVVVAGRLDGNDRQPRPEGEAARQPAATAADEREIGHHAQRRKIRHHFKADRALPGDDERIIERRDDGGAGIGGEPPRDDGAVFSIAIIEHHPRAVRLGGHDLHRRRVGWHDNGRRDVEELGRTCHALRMIAAAERNDAERTFGGRQRRQSIVRTTKLEAARTLQALGLEPDAAAGHGIEGVRTQQWGTDCVTGQTNRCGSHVDVRNH